MKGEAFQVFCPVRAAPGRGTISSRRCPSPEGPPWLYGILNSSSGQSYLIVQLKRLLRGPRFVSRNMRKSPCGTFFGSLRERRSKRAYTGTRGRTAKESSVLSRTGRGSGRTCRPNHTIKTRMGCLYIEQGMKKNSPYPISARFALCRKAEKVPIGNYFACFN